MPQHHLTAFENNKDYRIRQGSRYSLTIKIPGDKTSGFALKSQIRKKDGEATTLAVLNAGIPSYDSVADKTSWTLFLTASQTSNIPKTNRTKVSENKIGINVWCWDVLLEDLGNLDNNLRLIDISFVEVIPEVTLA